MKQDNTMLSGAAAPERILYLDYLRVFACLAVILLHVASSNFGNADVNGADWKVFNLFDSIARWGVPVFLMISGALFLRREDIPLPTLFRKYILRLSTAYCVWCVVDYLTRGYSVRYQLSQLFTSGSIDPWLRLLKGPSHLWFLLLIIGIYLCMPLLKQIVRNPALSRYYLLLSFVFWFLIPQTALLMEDFGNPPLIAVSRVLYDKVSVADLSLVMNYCFYFVLGYELSRRRFSGRIRGCIYLLGLLGFLFTVAVDQYLAIRNQAPCANYYENNCVNILLEAVAVFELFKNLPLKNTALAGPVTLLSKWSFGAYLVHMLVLKQLELRGFHTLAWPAIWSVPLLTAVVFLLSFGISGLLHRIPRIHKYIV